MYKKFVIVLCLVAAVGTSIYVVNTVMAAATTKSGVKLEAPKNGYFNKVLTVCLPHAKALTGAAAEMRAAGADKTFTHTTKDGTFYCYTRFLYNPNKEPKAHVRYGGRNMTNEKCDYWFSSIKQTVGCVNYKEGTKQKFIDKVERPETKPMFYAPNLFEAVNYLKVD